jgi:Leucine-rich repeat (LRR) protein
MSEQAMTRFSSSMPVIVLTRPAGQDGIDWQEMDRGPGYFSIPAEHELRIRIKGIDDQDLLHLVKELQDVEALRFLDLAENRNVTNEGIQHLKALTQLTGLNLSSCSVTDTGLKPLVALHRLAYLNLSYCNRLSDPALKHIEAIRSLVYVDLQGCLGIGQGGLARVRRKNLTIYR